jgi:deoxycytidylate deaminase
MATQLKVVSSEKSSSTVSEISPTSNELVIGLVGHVGAGASTAGRRIRVLLEEADYTVIPIKLSQLIIRLNKIEIPPLEEGANAGISKFARANLLQDQGDEIRRKHGDHALSVAAIAQMKKDRGEAVPGESKIAFVLDSLKHPDEVRLLRKVYDHSFRLVAVHCDVSKREDRLIGTKSSSAKYGGVKLDQVIKFMNRDSKDDSNNHGQRVRDVFHLADFFLDNTSDSQDGSAMNVDIDRFVHLLLDQHLVRPTVGERAIYHAYAASLQSACLSRQVGAALVARDGALLATGANDPPKFGGGIYDEDSRPDNRCHIWSFGPETSPFRGCHNDRKKYQLYAEISEWMSDNLAETIAKELVPPNVVLDKDLADGKRAEAQVAVRDALAAIAPQLKDMPGVKDAIEYSRAIHAEMATLLAAARSGAGTVGTSLYVTTYPCHNCARHLVAAGVARVYFIEPYVKSLAVELHSDAIVGELPHVPIGVDGSGQQAKMAVVPFTGVGPRMYEDFFVKRGGLKGEGGVYQPRKGGTPFYAVRLRDLNAVENDAVNLIPEFETDVQADA